MHSAGEVNASPPPYCCLQREVINCAIYFQNPLVKAVSCQTCPSGQGENGAALALLTDRDEEGPIELKIPTVCREEAQPSSGTVDLSIVKRTTRIMSIHTTAGMP